MKNTEVIFYSPEDRSEKEIYAEEVYKLLDDAYQVCGGINVGSGFKNPCDMLNSIPYWRLTFQDGRLVTVMMFKVHTCGLKLVAYAPRVSISDSIDQEIRKSDFCFMMNESFAEVSGALLIVLLRYLGEKWNNYVLDKRILNKTTFHLDSKWIGHIDISSLQLIKRLEKDYPTLLSCLYIRRIGMSYKVKVILGSIKKGGKII